MLANAFDAAFRMAGVGSFQQLTKIGVAFEAAPPKPASVFIAKSRNWTSVLVKAFVTAATMAFVSAPIR